MKYVIEGKNRLFGEINIQAAKNSVLALIAGSVLVSGDVLIENCPKIYDVLCMCKILKKMGAKVKFAQEGLLINTDGIGTTVLPEKLTNEVRASLFMVGALLSRFKSATMSRPGGCNIGSRPMDIHVDALTKMGVKFSESEGVLRFSAEKLKGANVRLKYPSVGATENLMMAGVFAEGVTVVENCAKEPEICDLQNFLCSMGAKISGAGTSFIRIEGVKKLYGRDFKPIPDRIETGTFLLAAATCGGELLLKNTRCGNILVLIEKMQNNACKIRHINDNIYIIVNNRLKGFGEIVTSPYPGFPTDLQPLVGACACSFVGKTVIKETVFESRFRYANELVKMGADLSVNGDTLEINGGELFGAEVLSPDLRGGAGLCLAALSAEGETVVGDVGNVERGYEDFDKKLRSVGAKIIKK